MVKKLRTRLREHAPLLPLTVEACSRNIGHIIIKPSLCHDTGCLKNLCLLYFISVAIIPNENHLLVNGGIPTWREGGEEVESDAPPQFEESRVSRPRRLENRTFLAVVRVIPEVK